MNLTPCRLRLLATKVAPSTSLMRSLLSEWGRRQHNMPSIWFLTPSGLTVAVEPAMQVDQCRRPFRVPTVLVAASYLRKTYVACGAVRQVSWPSLSSATAERGNQKPFAAAYLSSFPLGPELT